MKNWLLVDHHIHLPKLFEHLGFRLVSTEKTHSIFKKGGAHYVVIRNEKGFLYYKVQRPQEKLSASDLIIEHVSKSESMDKDMIWDKVDSFYKVVLETETLLTNNDSKNTLDTVPKDFNHFLSYTYSLNDTLEGLYADLDDSVPFSGRVFQNEKGKTLFPLFNMQNEVCGHFIDEGKGTVPYGASAIKHSLWYSNIPKSIEGLFLFKDPKEALAFHRKFQLKNVVYMALGEINSQTTDILFQIQRLTKVNKLFLSFTGDKKIEGYLRDLHFISYIKDSEFKLTLTDRDMRLLFPIGKEKSFSKFYEHTQQFNKALAKSFLKYNTIIDQNRLNKYSIMISTDNDKIKVRLPLETNAIKLSVWSYYKNYLNKTIDILKPKSDNWYGEWQMMDDQTKKGREVQLKEYRIAL